MESNNTYKIVLLRHGESIWNKENRFTGWTDVLLTEQGINEAIESGKLLKEKGFVFDLAFTSLLKRANATLFLALDEMNQMNIEVKKSYKLNERHYGALQGFNKAKMAEEVGEEQVQLWRRSSSTRPPALEEDDPRYSGNDPLYSHLPKEEIPLTENLNDTIERVLEYWESDIIPAIKKGESIIIVAHGNSLRALVKYLDKLNEEETKDLNIPTGIPLIYELDKDLNPLNSFYLER